MDQEFLAFFPNKKIYGPIGFLIGICIGGPLAAGYMVTRNRKAFGKKLNKGLLWILSLLGVLVIFFLVIIFPPNRHFPWYFPFLNLLTAYWLLMRSSTKDYFAYRHNGGQLYSIWLAIAIGVAGLVITFGIITLGVFARDFV